MNLGSLPEANGYDASSDEEIAATHGSSLGFRNGSNFESPNYSMGRPQPPVNTPSVRPFMPVMPHTPVMSPGENEVLSMLQTQQALLTQALDGQKEIAQRQKDAEERQKDTEERIISLEAVHNEQAVPNTTPVRKRVVTRTLSVSLSISIVQN